MTVSHQWQFFRSGGFDQVRLDGPADLAALRQLDQKLWTALACPVKGLEFDERTLNYIDDNKDGRIRAPELLNAVDWALSVLAEPGVLFKGEELPLSAINDSEAGRHIAASAKRLLANTGRTDASSLSLSDTDDMAKIFPPEKPNGDGFVPAAMTENDELKLAIADVIAIMGAETDRSGEAAVSEEKIVAFFEQADALLAWKNKSSSDASLLPLGDKTAEAVATLDSLYEKIEDFFNRVGMAGFDPRAAALMNGEEAELVRLAALSLANTAEALHLPLAHISESGELPLKKGINPAWAAAVTCFREKLVQPLLGEKEVLTEAEWREIANKVTGYRTWLAEKPAQAIDGLEAARVEWLVNNGIREKLLALVAEDKAVEQEAASLLEVDKLARFQRYLVPLLNNFVSFSDFYTGRDKAIFQAGSLFIDGKSCDLVISVGDIAKHSAMAGASGSYLVYCECTRQGSTEKRNIVATVTAGDAGKLMNGRNGIFYDRKGVDWDAHVVKLIENPISVREAFWTPYRRIGKMISDQIQKMAASRDKSIEEKSAASVTASAAKVEAAPAAAATAGAPATPPPAPFDIAKFAGIFAAIGLAIGAIGTALAAVATGFLSLKLWQMPLALLGVMLLISGPSMLLAWFKLRKRNLAPILDANGWAVNTEARINILFGSALTQLAALPKGAKLSLTDPYASKSRRSLWLLVLLGVAVAAWWLYQKGMLHL
jgi:hypothetical protein